MLTTDPITSPPTTPPNQLSASPEVPSFAFDPNDPWTATFQRGLQSAGLQGKKAYEVGIGTGINAIFLLTECEAEDVSGSDLDPRLIELAESNVHSMAPEFSHRFNPVRGAVSLIDTDEAHSVVRDADVVIASLPQVGEPGDSRIAAIREALQVPLPNGAEDVADDHIAHYYPWIEFDQYPFNSVGLGLNEALLTRVRKHAPQAEVVMNFGCRIGSEIIFDCFKANGFQPEKLSSQIVEQHSGTDISFFIALEKTLQGTGLDQDFRCRFYADKDATKSLSACEAQELVKQNPNASLFHEVCVIRGTPTP
ncbi:hypothetical protein [Pseudomaricurvus sp.]|uniref:hypothetical protein n=1 Tax=Pseudomaricurvus sp. TaxID=2004510 RepID=UPI003F6B5E29